MTLSQYRGLTPFPYLTLAIGGVLGTAGGIAAHVVFWGDTPGGTVTAIGLGFWGLRIGSFLGLCHHMVAGVCRCW